MRLRSSVFFVCLTASVMPFAVHAAPVSSTGSTAADATSYQLSTTSSPPLILQMANGRFYNPSSGQSADTREGLIVMLNATTTPPAAAASSTVAVVPPPPAAASAFPLRDAIRRGQQLLADRFKGEAATPVLKQKPVWLGVTLAVWNKKTDDISFMDLQIKGKTIKTDDNGGIVSLKTSNGVNSQFVFPNDPDKVTVALRYPITTATSARVAKTTCRKKHACRTKTVRVTRYTVDNVIYTPYSPALQTPEMTAWGERVFGQYVSDAYAGLRQDGIRSRAFPNRLVSDVVDPDLVRGIMAIEHLDNRAVKDGPGAALGTFFVMLGANQDHAYAYARSSAKALGLAQFIPSTYQRLQKRAELKLNPSFEEGMRDPNNAVRAEVAYLDEVLADLPASVKSSYDANRTAVNEYMAAAYNGGTARVKKAIATWGDTWAEPQSATLGVLTLARQKLKSSITLTKRKIARGASKKALKKLRASASAMRNQLAALTVEIARKQGATLKQETYFYVQKYRELEAYLRPQLAVAGSRANPTAKSL